MAVRRQALQRRARFETQLGEWLEYDRTDDYTLTGVRLAEARELEREEDIARRRGEAREYLRRSLALAEAAQRRRVRLAIAIVTGLSLALFIAILAAGIAFQRTNDLRAQTILLETEKAVSEERRLAAENSEGLANRARSTAEAERQAAENAKSTAVAEQDISRSRELAAIAINQIEADPERAVLIALEAIRRQHTFEAEDALRQAVNTSIKVITLREQVDPANVASVNSARFSPDGRWLVTAGGEDTARIWEANTGKLLVILQGHTEWIWDALFSPDGQRVVTASDDGTARLWEAASGVQLAVLRGHGAPVLDAQFSPDGKRVVTASDDGTARIFLVYSTDVIELALSQVSRQLTPEERAQYLGGEIAP
ncbi:MAG TPA: hypothetical protein VI776_03395 [Anaerolineales bacterium]|nr:hypothetical protein [Anaerolineales bacterium]